MTPERWHVRVRTEKEALAKHLVEIALEARYPRKSLSALLREGKAAGVREALVNDVGDLAEGALAEALREDTLAKGVDWLTPSQAARRLGRPLNWVRSALESEEGRRALGFPWFDRKRWWIPAPACDPSTRSGFLASLPDQEPEGNLALLGSRQKGAQD